jgi:hypothetical protein
MDDMFDPVRTSTSMADIGSLGGFGVATLGSFRGVDRRGVGEIGGCWLEAVLERLELSCGVGFGVGATV